jgi:hypothetical protein
MVAWRLNPDRIKCLVLFTTASGALPEKASLTSSAYAKEAQKSIKMVITQVIFIIFCQALYYLWYKNAIFGAEIIGLAELTFRKIHPAVDNKKITELNLRCHRKFPSAVFTCLDPVGIVMIKGVGKVNLLCARQIKVKDHRVMLYRVKMCGVT